jgi:serine/threonine protein kinase
VSFSDVPRAGGSPFLPKDNIAGICGLEEASRVSALVMELVEGEDLSQRLARGPMSVDDAVPIARQIAEALEAAHEQRIIHRDLKPANVKVRADGAVKVLDFGLAKALEPARASGGTASDIARSPTITSPAITEMGVILGTAAYMSPPDDVLGFALAARACSELNLCATAGWLNRLQCFGVGDCDLVQNRVAYDVFVAP